MVVHFIWLIDDVDVYTARARVKLTTFKRVHL